ncbi:MAG: bifunctional diaminohydroxyphosphoribosylaminopyrimidine deaminase/5-amino-6-(5-phosphoribosylamino)uracil reductase RibD [Saprospiraceae bacterium]
MHESFLRRCFDLARLGAGSVSPNPLVGAVLVHAGRIIGEGWHQRYGEAHAEVNCLLSVSADNQALIPHSTLYCSLEPCSHFGKTPPCVDLILAHKIPRVVVSNTDPNPLVAGQGLRKLADAGVEVIAGILEAEGAWLNRAFFTWITRERPYIILKWAQSRDGYLGKAGERTAISGPVAQRLVHRWRSEVDAILVGTTTAIVDNPRLDNRLYYGKSPLRLVFDRHGQLPPAANLLDDSVPTWIFGPQRLGDWQQTQFFPSPEAVSIPALLGQLRAANRAILLVEGGAQVLQQWLDLGYWDEVRILENERVLGEGLRAPGIPSQVVLQATYRIGTDSVRVFAAALKTRP